MSRVTKVSTAVIITGVVGLIVAVAVLFVLSRFESIATVRIGDGVFDARVAYTEADRQKGLGGETRLSEQQAFILAFPSDGKWEIWMKDMKIPIDIVWLDADKKVVYIVKNASPDGGTDVIFAPKVNARYVIEFPAGTVESKNIVTGRAAIFDIKEESVQ